MSGTYTDNYRYRYGETTPIRLAWKSGTAVNLGDLAYEDASDSNTVKPAFALAWASAVANGVAAVKISYQFRWGEGALSAAGTATPTLAAQLLVSGAVLVPPTPALYTNVYVETAAGSGVFKLYATTQGQNVVVEAYG